jgi:hypothetical protein
MTVVSLDMAYRLYGAFVVKRCFAPFSYLIRDDHAARIGNRSMRSEGARPVSATVAPACLYSVGPQWTRTMMQ